MSNEPTDRTENLYYEDLITFEAKTEKAQEIAINLLNNLDANFISKMTDLPIEEIQSLIKKQ